MMDLPLLVGQVFNGFSVASLFILATLGLALSFGLMRVINMAHGGHCQVVFNRRLRAPFPASGGECFGHVCPEAECVSPGVAV